MKNKFSFSIFMTVLSTFFLAETLFAEVEKEKTLPPNIVLIFTDDQGYSDVGCFGAIGFQTPHLDRLAENGKRFTSFYVPASICSPSRAALMTGCYPARVGVTQVLFPTRGEHPGPGRTGLHPDEITLAEILEKKGYRNAIVGKWHLGDDPEFLPTKQGFDEYFGIPYSNDMGDIGPQGNRNKGFPPLPLYEGEKIVETEPDQRFLTRRYTERAVEFIDKNQDGPFFLYLAHTMPHTPLAVHPDFAGTSEHGLYGDVIQELDWSVGEIVRALRERGLEKKTLIVFASDNGPWLAMGKNGGHAEPLRDGKMTPYEGGHRVPCIMSWPGRIKENTLCEGLLASIDLLPTFARLAGAEVPQERTIDGVDVWDYIADRSPDSPRMTVFLGRNAVRHEHWKLILPGKYMEYTQIDRTDGSGKKGEVATYTTPRLFNLETDIREKQDIFSENVAMANRLMKLLEDFHDDVKRNSRPVGSKQDGKIP